MIIYPSPYVPIREPQRPLFDIHLFPVMQTQQDYMDLFRTNPPPVDPSHRAKYWLDPAYAWMEEDNGEEVTYKVLSMDPRTGAFRVGANGEPIITTMTISKYLAGRVNIPAGVANEYPSTSAIMRLKPLPVPIRDLHPHEKIVMGAGFHPTPMVINTHLNTVTAKDLVKKIRELIDDLERKLG